MIQPLTDEKPYTLTPGSDGVIETQTLEVSIGPQHPSTHGVFRMDCVLDGESVVALKPVMGYLHRNHEQLAERMAWLGSMPYTDRLDYFNSMTNNWAYALAVEKLAGIKVPDRAEYIRVIMAELTRLLNHSCVIGFMLQDLGAWGTPLLYAFRERERILDLFEAVSGSRMMCNYMRFGGVRVNLTDENVATAKDIATRFPRFLDEFEKLLTNNEVLLARTQRVGVLPKELALNAGISGPMARASGVDYDLRKVDKYGVYSRLDFRVPLGDIGDVYDRYYVRVLEMRESIKILQQALRDIPQGPFIAPEVKLRNFKIPPGDGYGRVEGPKGELGFYLVSDEGGKQPYRYHVRPPSFVNLTILEDMCVGHKVADVVVILGSVDIVLGEVDPLMGFIGKGLFEGMVVTARNFVGSYFDKERLVTVQYPEERVQVPENSRTFPFLVFDKDSDPVASMRCVACKICEVECPPQCIYIVMDRDEKGKPQQRPKVFDIDISVCMQCQICVEVCPFDAIKMDNNYEKSQYGRFDELVEHLPELLKSNEFYNKIKPTEATAVDAKLKAEAEKKAKKAAPAGAKPSAPAPKPTTPPAPKPVPAAAPMARVTIPDDAPFTPEQRQWLSGYLAAVGGSGGAGAVAPAAAAPTTEAPVAEAAAPATEAAPATDAPAGNWPWHDPGLGMQQRLDLAKDTPIADKLMAAMAQTDCHACGYDCRGYADAIATGAETDLSLCLPGEAETANMLKKLMQEAGKV